jgi:hypothetical protein
MNRWEQFRQTLERRELKRKLAFFLILSFAAVLLAVLLQSISLFWSNVVLEFAVAFGAVGILQLLWDFLGGEPIELRIEEVKEEVISIKSSMALLSDLTDGNIGLERIWPDRRTWEKDAQGGKAAWDTRIHEARHVDIVSNTLWNNWMHREEFRQGLLNNIARGAQVRIVIYNPNSDVLKLRAADEKDPFLVIQREKVYQAQQEIISTLNKVAEIWNNLPAPARTNLKVRLTAKTLHLAQIIRVDERMLVATYLSGKSGGLSPTMQLRGAESSYFRKHADQFKTLWEPAEPLDDARLSQILEKYGYLPTPPAEDSEPL